jgi:hypothetical protein
MKITEFLYDKGGDCDRVESHPQKDIELSEIPLRGSGPVPGIKVTEQGGKPGTVFYPMSRIVWMRLAD